MSDGNLQRVVAPLVRVVVMPRGHGKTTLAGQLPTCTPWGARQAGFYPIDVQPGDDPSAALSHARDMDDWFRSRRPGVQCKVFIRPEDWYPVSHLAAHHWLKRTPGAVVYLTAETPKYTVLCDATNVALPGPIQKMAQGYLLEHAVLDFASQQTEAPILLGALPSYDRLSERRYTRLPYARALKAVQDSLHVRGESCGLYGAETPNELFERLQLAKAGRRIKGAWEWSPIWLRGLRELQKHSA